MSTNQPQPDRIEITGNIIVHHPASVHATHREAAVSCA
jgi:hypothetical protein